MSENSRQKQNHQGSRWNRSELLTWLGQILVSAVRTEIDVDYWLASGSGQVADGLARLSKTRVLTGLADRSTKEAVVVVYQDKRETLV